MNCLMFAFQPGNAWRKRLWQAMDGGKLVRRFMEEQFSGKIEKMDQQNLPEEWAQEVWRHQDDDGSFTARFFGDDDNRVTLEVRDSDHPPAWWERWEKLAAE